MSATFETIALVVAASTPAAGFVVFFLSKFLMARKEIWQLQMKDERHDEDIKEHEERIKKLEADWNRVGRDQL